MAETDFDRRVDAVRRFNRFYTRRIGVLHEGLLESPYSLTEVRVLYEIAHRDKPTASELGTQLGLDPGYLSRILARFKRRGLVGRTLSQADGRQSHLWLTAGGRRAFATLNARSQRQVAAMLSELAPEQQRRLLDALRTIEELLGARPDQPQEPYILRPHEAGDMGWVVHRHGVLYAEEHHYDEQFEALVAEITAHFVRNYDPKRERCWMAERDGRIIGSVFLVQKSKTVAKLRLLLVEPEARGLGLGTRLVAECIRFARQVGYRKITLWTQQDLHAARHIYERSGFSLVGQERHHSFGQDLVGETWEMAL